MIKKYQIIYADPPWYFPANYGKVGKSKLSGFGAALRYDLMTNDDILNLSVHNIADMDCALFLWCVNSQVPLAINVIERWGFTYKTVAFCWVKIARDSGIPNCRLGYWTLGGMELCLLGIKGKMKPVIRNTRQVVMHHRVGHSVKPPIIRESIAALFGDVQRIELFARQKVEGWDCWGNEVESDIEL